MLSIRCCSRIRSKIIPDNANTKLVPDRVYKENRANWNSNYNIENQKQTNANWSLSAWDEPQPNNWNNQSQNNLKSARKVSAKQHYLSVARYVAGQSTNLPYRYQHFRTLLKAILITNLALILGYLLACYFFGQQTLHQQILSSFHYCLILLHLKEPSYTWKVLEKTPEPLFSILHSFIEIPNFKTFLFILEENLIFILQIVDLFLSVGLNLIEIIRETIIFVFLLIVHIFFNLFHYFLWICTSIYSMITDPYTRFNTIKLLVKYPCKSSWGRILGISRFCEHFLEKFVENSWKDMMEDWLNVIKFSDLIDVIIKCSPLILDLLYKQFFSREKLTVTYIVIAVTLYIILTCILYL